MKNLMLIVLLLLSSLCFAQYRTDKDSLRARSFAQEINTAFENLKYLKLNAQEQRKMMVEMRKMNMDAAQALPMVVMQSRQRRLENDSLRKSIEVFTAKQDLLLKYAKTAEEKAEKAERLNSVTDNMFDKIILGCILVQLFIHIMAIIVDRRFRKNLRFAS